MIEQFYSPLTSREVQATIENNISSTPRPGSYEMFPQKPDNFYFGEVSLKGFKLAIASTDEQGYPILEVLGLITPINQDGKHGSLIKIQHRPGKFRLLTWVLMMAFLLVFLLLVLLSYNKTGELSTIIILPTFGLCALLFFSMVYKGYVVKSRNFLLATLHLQKLPTDI